MVQLNNKENAHLRSSQSDLYKDTGNTQPPKKAILRPQRGLIRMVLLVGVIGAALMGTLIMQELLSDTTPARQPTGAVPISRNSQGGNQPYNQLDNQPNGTTFTATKNGLVTGQLDQAQVNQRFPIVAGITQTVAATFQSLYDTDSGERTIAVKDGGISFDITKKAKYLYVDLKEDGTYFKVQDNGIDVFRVDYDKNVIVHKGATFHLLGKFKDAQGSTGDADQVLTAPGGNGSPTWANAAKLTSGGLDCTNCINQDEIEDVYLFNTGDTITGDLTLNSQSDLRLADSNSSNYVAFQAPTNVSSNVTWTLPSADGSSSQTLSTDGSGTLSWTSVGAASVSADSLDFTEFSDTLSLDADTSIAAGAAEELTYNKTFTDATSENGFVINFTASDTTSGTTAQYGLYLDNIASTEGVDAVLVIDNSDTNDSVANGLLFIDAGGTIVDALDASDAGITNALNVGANTIAGTTAVIDFTDFDVSNDGAITVANDGDVVALTVTPSVATTTAIDVSNALIVNALSVGANTITGATAVIDFTDFDVSADGLITVANDADGVALTVTPSVATTTAIDASNALIVNALSVGANTITGATAVIDFTNFDVSSDGQVNGADGLVTKVVAGTCSDSNFVTDTDGTLCLDSTNGRIYFRYGGAWHYVTQTAGFVIPEFETEGLAIGDVVIGRLNERQSDGALHGLWEKVNYESQIQTINELLGIPPIIVLEVDASDDSDTDADIEELSTKQATVLERLSAVEAQLAVYTLANSDQPTADGADATDDLPQLTLDDLKDLVVTGSLIVQGDTTIFGDLTVEGDASVAGSLTRGNEEVGETTIPAGNRWTKVSFSQSFTGKPTVTVTAHDSSTQYVVEGISSQGFTISLTKNPGGATQFSWHALVQDEAGSSAVVGGGFEATVISTDAEPGTDEPTDDAAIEPVGDDEADTSDSTEPAADNSDEGSVADDEDAATTDEEVESTTTAEEEESTDEVEAEE